MIVAGSCRIVTAGFVTQLQLANHAVACEPVEGVVNGGIGYARPAPADLGVNLGSSRMGATGADGFQNSGTIRR